MSRSEPLRLPVPSDAARALGAPQASAASLQAHLLGQGGVRRGLRGGAAVLKQARGAYLATEWSGEDDRRPETGLLVRGRV